MTKGRRSRQRILDGGLLLASEQGLSQVTLGDLAARTEMSKSGLFAHFASKEAMQIELLDAAEALLFEQVVTPCIDLPAGLPKLRAIVERWLGWASAAGLPGGCPLYAAAFEFDDQAGPVRHHLERRHQAWLTHLQDLVAGAIAAGDLPSDTEPVQVTFELEGIYLAHHLAQRFTRDTYATERARRAVDALFGAQPREDQP